jgi:hypothetical protein
VAAVNARELVIVAVLVASMTFAYLIGKASAWTPMDAVPEALR